MVKAMKDDPDALFSEPGCASLLAVGQSLPFKRGGSVSLPLDVSKTLEELLAQEQELQFASFTNDDAWALGTALVAVARS